ncbi:MAG: DUF3465 domain-containing protein [Wenzhouxiangellaceae bacterium]|nr:DUF3465 domain-containing protein [Wenzhouxiangellaceae bacterium]
MQMFEAGRTGVWVSGQGEVTQVLADEELRGTKQRFIVRPNDRIMLTVKHSLDDSDRVPVERGDTVRFQGLYEWDARGGFVVLTHSDPEQPGGGGWIEHEGTRYD